ncbi:MAG: hypothetical protein H6510_16705 [Acidobacteria bacterium]|nr:hypothetical protein [Acidobacteriota bacterium]MCB9399456.1 hypothetical protein [Acidobacteriota bacterium]
MIGSFHVLRRAQLKLGLLILGLIGLLYFGMLLPIQRYLHVRAEWLKQAQAQQDVQRKLEDRKLLEAYDETFREELNQNLAKLQPYVQNQEYLREIGTRVKENKLNLQSMDVDLNPGIVRISIQVLGSYESVLSFLHGLETHPMPIRLIEWQASPKGNDLDNRIVLALKEMGS